MQGTLAKLYSDDRVVQANTEPKGREAQKFLSHLLNVRRLSLNRTCSVTQSQMSGAASANRTMSARLVSFLHRLTSNRPNGDIRCKITLGW